MDNWVVQHAQKSRISRLLVANRGEIACRILRACRAMHIAGIAVYSDADTHALHVRLADEAVPIGPAPSRESYLQGERIVAAAVRAGAQAIHPGYGFLSENAAFAQAVMDAGLIWIGPTPDAMRRMGSKLAGRASAVQAGVPVAGGFEIDGARWAAESGYRLATAQSLSGLGLPALVKAVAGGGGRGMRVVRAESEFEPAVNSAMREAANAFGDGAVFVERFIEQPHHVEIQVLGDAHGNVVHLFERECSVQRRHQKIIEESPSPFLTPELRARMGAAALRLAASVGYSSAGTLEFLVDARREFCFLEMNTRLQVEHPVTEMITGLDLVQAQIRIAQGETLDAILPSGAPGQPLQGRVATRGHAIEARICAENPADGFMPSMGRLTRVNLPDEHSGVRVECGVASGDEISPHYDSLIAKIIAHADTRPDAIAKLSRALRTMRVTGVDTNLDYLQDVLAHPAFAAGDTTTAFLERYFAGWRPPEAEAAGASDRATPAAPSAGPWQQLRGFRLGQPNRAAPQARQAHVRRGGAPSHSQPHGPAEVRAPMPGVIREVLVRTGEPVARGATLIVMEAMKMEMRLTAPRDGKVAALNANAGNTVAKDSLLAVIAPAD